MRKFFAEFFFVNILVAIDKIKRNTKHISYNEFVSSEKIFDLVIRELQEIGESAGKLLKEGGVTKSSGVEWKEILGFRNVVVHKYFSINPPIVFEIVQKEIPLLEKQVLGLIEKLQDKTFVFQVISDLKLVFEKINRDETLAYLTNLESRVKRQVF